MSTDEGPKKVTAKDGHVYHKSATANASVAPVNQTTLDNAAKTKGLSSLQSEFVTILDYEWRLRGNIDPARIKDEYGYSNIEFNNLAEDQRVVTALTERGLPVGVLDPEAPKQRSKLTPIQLMAANAMLDLVDNRSTKQKLKDLGVTSYVYNSWLRDPEFSAYLKERAEGMLGDVQHEAMLSLIDRVMAGDTKAIEYYHEITGRFVRQSKQPASNVPDLQQTVVRIIEIIVEEVDDPEVAAKIAGRLRGLAMGNQVAGLTGPEIIQPEIAQVDMNPARRALMERGVGYNE